MGGEAAEPWQRKAVPPCPPLWCFGRRISKITLECRAIPRWIVGRVVVVAVVVVVVVAAAGKACERGGDYGERRVVVQEQQVPTENRVE